MADVYEKDLAQKTQLTTSDFIRVVGSDNVSYKQGMSSVLASMGLSLYYEDTNSASDGNTDIDRFKASFQRVLTTFSNSSPTTNRTYPIMIVTSGSSAGTFTGVVNVTSTAMRFLLSYSNTNYSGQFVRSSSTVTVITRIPTGAEVDTLKSRLAYDDVGSMATISALTTALETKLSAMANNTTILVRFLSTVANTPFESGVTYLGELRRGGSASYASISFYGLGIDRDIIGSKKTSGSTAEWSFEHAGDATPVSTGTITKYSNISGGTLDSVTLRKVGNIVFGSARLYGISATANGTFFVIPTGFRPQISARVYGYMYVDGNPLPIAPYVQTSGEVLLPYSSSKTTTQVYFCGSWSVL